jgi:hypothetical protein
MKRLQVKAMSAALMLLLCSVTAMAQVKGSGTTDYVPVWTASGTIGNSIMYQTDSRIGIDTTSPQFALDVNGHINAASGYAIGETMVLALPGGVNSNNFAAGPGALINPTGSFNTAVGSETLNNTTTATANTAVGSQVLLSNTTGGYNTGVGYGALTVDQAGTYDTAVGAFALFNNTASDNTALGYEALAHNAGGSDNTASGEQALLSNTLGNNNTAGGAAAMLSNTSGSDNTAYGELALENNTTGVGNIAIGSGAAASVSGSNSNNIEIGSAGSSGDSGAIRIGTSGTQTSFFVARVRGVTTGENDAVPVVIDSNGQLGTISSSRRFKTDIQDMGDASRGLLRLRPVTFRYQKPFADGSQPIQYGLIAEEVEEVYPHLVARSADGQIETVKYQVLDAMLLNELQRQQAEIAELRDQLAWILTSISTPEVRQSPVRGPSTANASGAEISSALKSLK